MKKQLFSLLALCLLGVGSAFAQDDIVVGDMNDDGQLTVGDVTALTETVIGRTPKRTISTKCDPNASDPSAIAGSWRALDKSTLELTAEGKATVSGNGTVTDFEYYPYSRDLVLLNAGGYVVQDYHVLRLAKDYLVFRLTDGSYATYYPSDRYATTLTLGTNKLSLKTGETHLLSVEPTPPGTIMPAITWESSNTTVATVSADGLVTAVKGGRCTIIARAADGSWEATCNLTITQLVESITLSSSRLLMGMYAEQRLVPTVLPADAEDVTLTWTSSDENVAEVSKSGLVYTVGYGRCTITATANDGSGVKAECVIIVEPPHEYVDLGLPSGTLWATCNVGADNPEDYGYYFAWGEVEPKSNYDWSTYFDSVDGSDSNFKKYYNNGGKTELDLEDDAAYMNWGEGWRMPSDAQLKELSTNCTWTWDSTKKGYNVVGPNNCSLFLPAAGDRNEGSLINAGSYGHYWSRSLNTSYSRYAYYLRFNSSSIDWYDYFRYYKCYRCDGFSVRPVRVSGSE